MLHLILMSENVVSKWIDCELCWCEFHRKDIFNSVQESDSQKVEKQLVQIPQKHFEMSVTESVCTTETPLPYFERRVKHVPCSTLI